MPCTFTQNAWLGFPIPMNNSCPAEIPTQSQYFSSSFLNLWGLLLCFCSSKSYLHYPNESDALGLVGCQLIFKCCNILVHMVVLFWCGFCNLSHSQHENQHPSWCTEEILTAGKWLSLRNNASVLDKNNRVTRTPFPVFKY